MAGEVIGKIKQKEDEAARIIEDAKRRARQIIQEAEEKKSGIFRARDDILKKDEESIRSKYEKETEALIKELERKENVSVEIKGTVGLGYSYCSNCGLIFSDISESDKVILEEIYLHLPPCQPNQPNQEHSRY